MYVCVCLLTSLCNSVRSLLVTIYCVYLFGRINAVRLCASARVCWCDCVCVHICLHWCLFVNKSQFPISKPKYVNNANLSKLAHKDGNPKLYYQTIPTTIHILRRMKNCKVCVCVCGGVTVRLRRTKACGHSLVANAQIKGHTYIHAAIRTHMLACTP